MWLDRLLRLGREIRSLPEGTIQIYGGPVEEQGFPRLVQPHPRVKLIQSKRWGAALVLLPDHFEEYLRGREKQALRTNRTRALRLGFRFAAVNPLQHLEEMLAINRSLQFRQGAAVRPDHLSIDCLW